MKVCKFGGTSLADENQVRKVRDIILSDTGRKYVIVSAPGKRSEGDEKITDMLYRAYRERNNFDTIFPLIEKRYIDMAKALSVDTTKLEKALSEIGEKIKSGHGGEDYAASRGEYLSALLFSAFLGWNFVDSKDFIFLNKDREVSEKTFSSEFIVPTHSVIPGFYGLGEEGEIKTFSRGGSDITGSIVSALVNAEVYENWTDVSGVFTADPRYVDGVRVIEEISYSALRSLATLGASVLHSDALKSTAEKGIPINIRNTNNPDERGTLIVKKSNSEGALGITVKKGLSLLSFKRDFIGKDLHKAYGAIASFSLPLYSFQSAVDSFTVYAEGELKDEQLDTFERLFGKGTLTVKKDMAILAVVYEKLNHRTQALSAKTLSHSLIETYTTNISEYLIQIGIEEKDAAKGLKVVHSALFGKEG